MLRHVTSSVISEEIHLQFGTALRYWGEAKHPNFEEGDLPVTLPLSFCLECPSMTHCQVRNLK